MNEPNISVQIHNLFSLLCHSYAFKVAFLFGIGSSSLPLTFPDRRPVSRWSLKVDWSVQLFLSAWRQNSRDHSRQFRCFFLGKQKKVNGSSMLSLHWDANINIGDLPASTVSQQRTNSFIWRFDCRDDEKQTRLRSDSLYVQMNSIWTLLNSFIDILVGIGYTGQDDEAALVKSLRLSHAIDGDTRESNDDRWIWDSVRWAKQ